MYIKNMVECECSVCVFVCAIWSGHLKRELNGMQLSAKQKAEQQSSESHGTRTQVKWIG